MNKTLTDKTDFKLNGYPKNQIKTKSCNSQTFTLMLTLLIICKEGE